MKVKPKSLVDHAVKYLEDMIVKSKFEPGQRITEKEVSTKLGISRPPVREAFKILEAQGLIKQVPRCGVIVSEVTKHDIWEIYSLKTALYSLAANLVIDSISNNGIERLENIVEKMEKLIHGDNPEIIKYEDLNHLFHETTATIAGHRRLKSIIQSLNNQIKRVSYKSLTKQEHLHSSCKYHRQILEAIKKKDKELSVRLTKEHIEKGLEVHKDSDEKQDPEVQV
jgi:DNA-binding GntR family transcriptional regulator